MVQMSSTSPTSADSPADVQTPQASGAVDPVEAHAGVVTETGHSAMRADIRKLGSILGETLAQQEGQELLDLVEKVRRLARSDDAKLTRLLDELDFPDAMQLARAFSMFFQLANVAEQFHRARELAARRRDVASPLGEVFERIREADVPADEVTAMLAKTELRPVFTAHPTEASRQSVLRSLRRVADLLGGRGPGVGAGPPAARGRRAAVADGRDPARQAVGAGRGAQHRLLPRPARPADAAGAVRRPRRRDAQGRRRTAARHRAAALRLVGRRRPGRQPERLAGGDRRRPPAARRPGHPRTRSTSSRS